ncbi:MAG: FG-GAP-like repeat-containing protein [Rhodothermales bacterium]
MRTYLWLLPLLLLVHSARAQDPDTLEVVSVFPAAQSLTAAPDTPVILTFNTTVDPATVDSASVMVFGRWSGVAKGTLAFEADNTQIRFTPERAFSAGETVTVALSRRLMSATGHPMRSGFAAQFWTMPRRASLDLVETDRLAVRRPAEGHVQTYGAYAGDFDGDGYTDFAVPNERANDVRFFMNDGAGSFGPPSIYPIPGGSEPSTNEGADFNLDGKLDFAVGNRGGDKVSVFIGNGDGTLNGPTNYDAADEVQGLAVLDLDGDGYPDIATANRGSNQIALLRNNGDGTFTRTQRITIEGDGAAAAAAADANEDGIMDLFVGTFSSREILLYLGDGEGGLTFHTKGSIGGQSWMLATGDVNGDGHVDVVSANSNDDHAAVVFNDGQGTLSSPVTYDSGQFPLAIDLGDLDGDGDLDMVTSNFRSADWTIFENAGDGTFVNPSSLPAGQAASCSVLHDRNNDGTLDMTGIDELVDLLFLFTNAPIDNTAAEAPPPRLPFDLLPNYPNPFSRETTVTFRLDAPGPVRLTVYDVLGREVVRLFDGVKERGAHMLTWDGRDRRGVLVSSGSYLYRLEAAGADRTRSMLFLAPPGTP